MVRLQYDGKRRYHVTVPQQIVKLKGWKPGTELIFLANTDGSLNLKEMPKQK